MIHKLYYQEDKKEEVYKENDYNNDNEQKYEGQKRIYDQNLVLSCPNQFDTIPPEKCTMKEAIVSSA